MARMRGALAALACVLALFAFAPLDAYGLEATHVDVTLEATSNWDSASLADGSYDTTVTFGEGDSLTVTPQDGSQIGSLYVRFARIPGPWTLDYVDGTGSVVSVACGQHDFLHEYVPIEGGATSATLRFEHGAEICTVDAYTAGDAPAWVQVWDPPCETADLMVCSTHADDEILWLGGVLATYAAGRDLDTQVVYMTNYWQDNIKREHEKLDGLWTIGVRNYPTNAPFLDYYAENLEEGLYYYDLDAVADFYCEQIRRFKPLVLVCQDFDGEYGHGGHQVMARAVAEAIEDAKDTSHDFESAQALGTWDVPKVYYHLLDENQITLDLRQPIEALGNMTAIEAANAAYLQHQTQQYTWFYITDDPDDPMSDQLNCSLFGLYHTTVGEDTQADMFEHITTYEEQAIIAEQERIAAEEAAAAEAQAQQEAEVGTSDRHADDLAVPVVPIIVVSAAVVVAFIAVLFVVSGRSRGRRRR